VAAEQINYFALLERLLKLSLPNLYLWLLMFFSFFHCFLNIMAELMRFGDRNFYRDWWNSLTLGEYWRLWNLPVHNWILRHLYGPLRSVGLDGGQSIYGVFFVSAFAHEYIISGSCHVFNVVAFFGMFGQAPMVVRMEWYKKFFSETQIGNVIFWVTFCIIGQPIAVMIYSYQVVKSYSA
jgi:diacylglycerol O-acyltransferase-1